MSTPLAGSGGFSRRLANRIWEISARKYRERTAPTAVAQPVQYVPTEQPNTLFSTSFAKVVDLVSEGEIAGLPRGLQSVFLNNTPLQNPDGSLNFTGVSVDSRLGTQAQSSIPGFDEVAAENAVNVAVTVAAPVTRTITNTAADAVRVIITVPALQEFTNKGDIIGASVALEIRVQYNGGGYTTAVADSISGRTSQQYQRQYVVKLNGAFPVDVRVVRITADSSSSKLVNGFSWSSYGVITYSKLAYPNSALVSLRVDAEQFNSIPSRTYEIEGLKVKIPNNATVDATTGRLIYAGAWNGTFGAAQWCSDPAWILWDLLTSTRYGFGDYLSAASLDKYAFYAASVYNNALVPDGFGGTEPRFSCSVNIQTADDAYRLINDLCSTMRAMPYWAAGALTISQDRPADPVFLFTRANVTEEGFSYSGSNYKNRPTVVLVKYFNNQLRDYDYEPVEDTALIAKYGYTKTEVEAYGCSSRGQAARFGRWLIYTEWNEGEVCSFTARLDAGAIVRPGSIVAVADPLRAGSRRGGIIQSATTTAITVDDATGLTTANSPTLSVMLSDGTVETRAVSAIAGNVITTAAFPAAPAANTVWVFESSNVQTSLWRVLGVEERDDVSYSITALAYNPSKYGFIEDGLALEQRDVTDLNVLPDAPTNLELQEVLYEASGSRAAAKIVVSWSAVPGTPGYQVSWRYEAGNWISQTTTANDYEILDSTAGSYEVLVATLSSGVVQSQPAQATFVAYGKTAAPAAPTGLSLIPIDGASAILSWDQSTEIDVRLGGKVLIRHSQLTAGASWETSTELVPSAGGSQTQKQVPLLTGTVLVKFEDDSGNRSLSAASVVVTLPAPQPRLLVAAVAEESGPFLGAAVNMAYSAELGGLALIPEAPLWDDLGDPFDSLAGGAIDALGDIASSGSYTFAQPLDLGRTYDVNLMRSIEIVPYTPASLWDDRPGDIDDWSSFEDPNQDRVSAALYVRTTLDDPASSPTWGPWREAANAIVRGRGLQFQARAESSDPAQSLILTSCGATVELQQRIESSATLTSSAGAYAVTFAAPFYEAPSVGITAYNLAQNEQFAVSAVTSTGFTIEFSDGAGSLARQFAYTAVGFGKAI